MAVIGCCPALRFLSLDNFNDSAEKPIKNGVDIVVIRGHIVELRHHLQLLMEHLCQLHSRIVEIFFLEILVCHSVVYLSHRFKLTTKKLQHLSQHVVDIGG